MDLSLLLEAYSECSGVSIDSRSVQPGEMFFALTGENVDGHRFVEGALAAGASYAVICDPDFAGSQTILVPDTLKALQDLSAAYRQSMDLPILAITGSNGKTTTKELVRRVLAEKYEVVATKGNYNNHIGVPITLLSIPRGTEIAIVEMGANHVGEIAFLCQIAQPQYGLITNIGKAHLEGFGSLEGVKKGKGELYDWLRTHEGHAFVNRDERFLAELADGIKEITCYSSGHEASDDPRDMVFADLSSDDGLRLLFIGPDGAETEVTPALYGRYNLGNVTTAIAVGLHFKVPPYQIRSAIESYEPDNNRSQCIERGTLRIVLDAYNANPSSMEKAVREFSRKHGSRVLILGEMRELGASSAEEHRTLVEQVSKGDWAAVFLVGEGFAEVEEAGAVRWFRDTDALGKYLRNNPLADSELLVKGSRSVGLERILDFL